MPDPCFIGIDLGTTGVKVGAFTSGGTPLAFARRGFALDQPQPGFAEFDVDKYCGNVISGLKEVTEAAGKAGHAIAGAGLSSQAQTFVLLDNDFRPLRPAISWLDVRARQEAEEMTRLSARLTGRVMDVVASAPKILWVARHEPDLFARCRFVSLLPDYVAFLLTGKRVTGLRSAESTGCYDLKTSSWIEPLLEFCHLTSSMMPEVGCPCDTAGMVTEKAAGETGLPCGIPVAVGSMDQLAGAIGTGNVSMGVASVALGTALAMVTTVDGESATPGSVAQRPHPVAGKTALLSYAKTAGVVLDWFCQEFAAGVSYDALFAEASGISPGSDGVVCLPHFAGMATPTFRPDVRGAFVGLALHHKRAHLMHAVVESLSFLVREHVERLRQAGGTIRILRVTGGGSGSDLWLQMIADVCGLNVEKPRITEAPSYGAAQFAMVTTGAFPDIASVSSHLYHSETVFLPRPGPVALYDEAYARFCVMQTALCEATENLPGARG